ncbi:MAG: hypothetical protein M2R45_05070 [Verrucomicrobia subdivision 3 bacterium]|nr:hypothetical protein [Limisphaerales bacterium]MCS1417735.1 hypothetical protein [Limisphaerales bacterium]
MSDKAHLSSVDALDRFRNRLIHYLEKTTAVVDEVSSEVRGTHVWLQDRQKRYWEHQVQQRTRALEEAQHEAFGARLSQFRESTNAQQMAVHRAKRALRQAEEKLQLVNIWNRRYQSEVEPLSREVEKLRTILVQDLRKGVAHLDRILQSLDGYLDRRRGKLIPGARSEDGGLAGLVEIDDGEGSARSTETPQDDL